MPVITLQIGKLEKDQKNQIMDSLTKTTASITGIPEEAFTVLIQEFEENNIGIGGINIGEIKEKYNKKQ